MPPRSLVSVVVPAFNAARYLRESLDSILAQTYPAVEVIVMDDASVDTTAEIAASYGGAIRCVRQPVNRGIYENANDGIALARGDYVTVFHADDVYHADIIEREVAFLEAHPEAGAVFCSDIFIDAEGREYGRLELDPKLTGGGPFPYPVIVNALLERKNPFLRCPGAMVRASVYRQVGAYRQTLFRNSADVDMWLRIARHYSIGILEDHLFRYRHFPEQSSRRYHHLRTEPERFFAIMDHHLTQGARAVATPAALAAYEAHRNEDRLMCAARAYVRGDLARARALLGQVRWAALLASGRVQRGRLLVLGGLLQALSRLPRSAAVAHAFQRRWQARRAPGAA